MFYTLINISLQESKQSIVNLAWHASALNLTCPRKFALYVNARSLGVRNG
jgi:hypothetical protein